MKKHAHVWIAALSLAALALSATPAEAKVRRAGNLGVGVGTGTLARGFSFKYFLRNDLAVQANLGVYGYGYSDCWVYYRNVCYQASRGRQALALGVDALSEQDTFFAAGPVNLAWNVGAGLGLGLADFDDDLGMSISLIAGLEILIDPLPVDIVLEYRPSLFLRPVTGFDYTYFTGHVRYFF